MVILYDLIFLIMAVIYLPIYLFKGKFHRGFWSCFGFLPKDLELNQPIWIHAVSVGEVIAVKGLLEELRKAFPGKKIVLSTVTATGNKIARNLARDGDYVTYLPLDFSFITQAVIKKINPCLFIIVETEIWPNLIFSLAKNKVPIVLVNGRISDASFRGYRAIRFLFHPVLDKINLFCVQTETDAIRFLYLGVAKEKIKVCGNLKFDHLSYLEKEKFSRQPYRVALGLNREERLLVAASTHAGEEKIILEVYQKLLPELPQLRLLIAPRHPQRSERLEGIIRSYGFCPLRFSRISCPSVGVKRKETVFILDSVGELLYFYALAEVVFVGGSLVRKGGHNILEPMSLGKPVLFGPYMFNFRQISQLFLENRSCVLVHNAQELKEKISFLLNHPQEAKVLGQSALEVISRNQGATRKTLASISENVIIK